MLPIRRSPSDHANRSIARLTAASGEGNAAWLARAAAASGLGEPGDLVLLGGRSVIDFRVRAAQAHARHDLTPSYWSAVGILVEGPAVLGVPLTELRDPAGAVAVNGIRSLPIAEYDDHLAWPNIAVLRFPGVTSSVLDAADRVRTQRSVIDLLDLTLAWLAYAWGVGRSANPLLDGRGLPGAAFVETAFGIAGVELTPGLASASSCPEAIWQSAKWWHEYYLARSTDEGLGAGGAGAAGGAGGVGAGAGASPSGASPSGASAAPALVPTGRYATRQPHAATQG